MSSKLLFPNKLSTLLIKNLLIIHYTGLILFILLYGCQHLQFVFFALGLFYFIINGLRKGEKYHEAIHKQREVGEVLEQSLCGEGRGPYG